MLKFNLPGPIFVIAFAALLLAFLVGQANSQKQMEFMQARIDRLKENQRILLVYRQKDLQAMLDVYVPRYGESHPRSRATRDAIERVNLELRRQEAEEGALVFGITPSTARLSAESVKGGDAE